MTQPTHLYSWSQWENTMTTPPRRKTTPEGVVVVLPADPTWLLPMLAHI
jgi:hypothetical protein